jgi:hypothetical protein
VEYYHIVGALRSQKDKPKYIYANGLRGKLFDGRLHWGVAEVVIGGSTTNQQDDDPENTMRPEYKDEEAGLEPAYLIPFMPMAIAEHYLGDRNNAALGFDISVNWPQDSRLYAELFIDDILTPWSVFGDDWGNKLALTLGIQHFANIYGRDVSATLEWSRVDPWVYTHFYGGSHRYDHFDKCLGSPLGPNSMAVAASGDIAITKKITAGLKFTSESSNPSARGGKITDIFQDPGRVENPDSEKKTFLGPGTVHYVRPGIYGAYGQFGMLRFGASFEVDVAEDRGRVHAALNGAVRF